MIILFTGGAANGKSSFAEQAMMRFARPYYYIATMDPRGEDGQAKVAKHQAMREGKGFTTIECPRNLDSVRLPERGTVLFEDIVNLVANEMFDDSGNMSCDVAQKVVRGMRSLGAQCDDLLMVTNEVGGADGPYSPQTRAYIEAVGKANAAMASEATYVYEVVCGIPRLIKGDAPAQGALPISLVVAEATGATPGDVHIAAGGGRA